MVGMTSTSTEVFWNSTELNPFQEFNITQDKINEYLEKLNYETFIKLLPMVVLFTVVVIVGLSGNLLVFLVYLKQYKVSATRVFVLKMAVCDFLTNIFTLPWVIQDMRYSHTSEVHFCRMKCFLGTFPLIMSYLLLVLVALDRRRRICQVHRRQLSARQATYLLIVPLVLTFAAMVPFTYLYGAKPLETENSQITGSTCGFSNTIAGISGKKIFGVILMIYFLVGFAILTTCYVQISYQIYEQKKKLMASKINIVVTFPVMETNFNEGIASSQDPQTENIFISTVKSEMSSEITSNQDNHSHVGTDTLTRDQREKIMFDKGGVCLSCKDMFIKEDKTDGHDSQKFCYQNEAYGCSPGGKDTETTIQLPQRSFDISNSSRIEILSEPAPAVQSSTLKETPNTTCGQNSFVSSMDNIKDDREINVKTSASSTERGEGSQKKKALLSKTTLMMLVLTISTLVCCAPYIAVTIAKVEFFGVHISTWQMNLYFLARFFPSFNSVINPFVYSFCNPKFRLKCHQFLIKVCNRQLLDTFG
ncbi:uncharacterized protein LOC112569108 [Pomacea canaliculata]|uniref:uncharacterized protein LOC112569108 n=1 Tax=Pomacea canaliculata TaxID=400727 RepID=UPI000D72C374|nr:uncharacterized protein LOC112569108 [Pomacea canaliculata]